MVVHELISPARTTIYPVRTCVGCRERAAKSELLRVVAGTDAEGRPVLVPDPAQTAPGRGAHLHPVIACFDLAVRRKAFPRALRVQGALDSEAVGEHLRESTARTNRP
ncbi:conserved hypothetical protein [metagenome]|uniref:YlxR domain-containing protein n=1 Tax=metagenome TaxID=256318 RepID=A0A2P2BVV4_9ZZZZ